MPLTRRARSAVALMRALSAVGLAPTVAKTAKKPTGERLAMGPPARLVGRVPAVPSYDVAVATRDSRRIRVRVYAPAGATTPVLYAHGGGFSVGGINACDHICRRLAVEADVVVVSVEYRLAPEHPFPGPLHDCEDALDWLLAQEWDTSRLVVAGDSAGGNLAAALALVMRTRRIPLAGQLLVYPMLDMTCSQPWLRGYRSVGATTADCLAVAEVYLAGQDPTDPYASPLLAPDLTGLPPALVVTVEHDPLRDDGRAYAARLQESGVPAVLVDVLDHIHGSLSLPALYPGIDGLYARMSAFLRDPAAATAEV